MTVSNCAKMLLGGALAMTGIGLTALPAAAASVPVIDFNPSGNYTAEVVSSASPGEIVVAYGYEFVAASNISVTALGTFDNGAVSNIGNANVCNGCNPLTKTSTTPTNNGDTVAIYSGTISGNGSLNGKVPLASLVIGGNNASGAATQVGGWAFVNLASALNLTSGNSYFILTTYSLVNFDPVAAFPSTITTNSIALTLGVAENCGAPNNCNLQPNADPGIFGPNFEIASTTPLPGALPLFVSGLGALGLLARRRRQKAALVA